VATSPTRSERSAAAKLAAKQAADERKAKKLHVIATRRAKSAGMSKQEFIGEVMKGKYRPITAEDLEKEPDPE
jgi:hypothetical protein